MHVPGLTPLPFPSLACFRIKIGIRATRKSVSPTVAIQLKRAEYINKKICDNLADQQSVVVVNELRARPNWTVHFGDP